MNTEYQASIFMGYDIMTGCISNKRARRQRRLRIIPFWLNDVLKI